MVVNHIPVGPDNAKKKNNNKNLFEKMFWLQFNFVIKTIHVNGELNEKIVGCPGPVYGSIQYMYLHFEIHKEIIRKQYTLPTLYRCRDGEEGPKKIGINVTVNKQTPMTRLKRKTWTLFAIALQIYRIECAFIFGFIFIFFCVFYFSPEIQLNFSYSSLISNAYTHILE